MSEIKTYDIKMKVALEKDAKMITKAYEYDAGFDIYSKDIYVSIPAHDSAIFDTGVHVSIPEGYVGFLKSKSGMNCKFSILNEGVIDAGYTGPIICKLYNNGKKAYTVQYGDKISQLVILPIPKVKLEQVEMNELEGGERGSNGIGSTGIR